MGDVHRIVARFSDGAEREFEADEGQPILTAALEAGVNLLYQCRAGSCSTCMCLGVSGEFQMDQSTSIALLPAEVREGKLLACLTRAKSDAVIAFSYESALLDRGGISRFTASVTEVVRVCDSVSELVLEIERGEDEPEFESGMFFLLRVPETDQWRAYSAVTTAGELPVLRFLIRHMPQGLMTEYVTARCGPGDRIEVEGPFGEFFIRGDDQPLVMMAGGTGLAPIISMLDSIRDRRRNRNKIILCFGVNRFDDLFYLEELELRRQMMPQLEVRTAVLVPDDRWDGPVGFVTDLLHPGDASAKHHAYICGPPPMIEAALEPLLAAGVPKEAVHYERFAPSSNTQN